MQDDDDAQYVGKYRPDTLYTHDWRNGAGRYLSVVTTEEGNQALDVLLEPHAKNRVKVRFDFVRERGDIKSVRIGKFKHYKHDGWKQFWGETGPETINLTPITFEKILSIIELIGELDIDGINRRRVPLTADDDAGGIDPDILPKLRTILMRNGGAELIEELLQSDFISSRDIVNIGYRRKQLGIFRRLLTDPEYISKYASDHKVASGEKAWQHFFEALGTPEHSYIGSGSHAKN